jgi:N6-adenosine-specific RNA methylase IME4
MDSTAAQDFAAFAADRRFATVLADPPWRFVNRTGKVAPEHRRLARYPTLTLDEIGAIPVAGPPRAHRPLLPLGAERAPARGPRRARRLGLCLQVEHRLAQGAKDGGSDGRGVGFYFRNVTEILLFGTRGPNARTLPPGRRQVNYLATRKREHSRKPDEQYPLIEACSPGPYLELFARGLRPGWTVWGNQADADYRPDWATYGHTSAVAAE